MIIVAGHLTIQKGKRDDFLRKSKEAVIAARKNSQCLAFSVSADLVESDRVCIFERWKSRTSLEKFRGNGPGDDLSSLIIGAEVGEFNVKS